MPRLPTILVTGSHVISTMLPPALVAISAPPLPRRPVAGRDLATLLAPARFLVLRLGRDAPQGPDDPAVEAAGGGGDLGAGRLVHEGHELVGEARHGAADADAADVGAPTDAVDPAPLRDVALDHRPPAAQFHQALGRAVLGGELALLVVAGPVAALVDGGAEEPLRPQGLVERDHRGGPGRLVEQVEDRLRQVVGVDRAARHV